MDLIWFAAFLLLAEILGTLGGFGSSMLVMPLAAWFLPFGEALGLTAAFHVLSNGAKMILFRDGIDRKLLFTMGIPAVVGVLIGAWLTAYANSRFMEIALGGSLLAISLFLVLLPTARIKATVGNAMVGGTASGFIAGLVGTGGAIRGVALAAFGLPKEVFVATSAWIDMGVDLSRSLVYWSEGYMRDEVWTMLPFLALTSLLGSYIGKRLLARISQDHFERIVLVLVMIVGAATLIRALTG